MESASWFQILEGRKAWIHLLSSIYGHIVGQTVFSNQIMFDFRINFYSWIKEFKQIFNHSNYDPWTFLYFCHQLTMLIIACTIKLWRLWCQEIFKFCFYFSFRMERFFFYFTYCLFTVCMYLPNLFATIKIWYIQVEYNWLEFSFPSSRLVDYPRLKNSICPNVRLFVKCLILE